jgi:hypothetical protein
LAVRGSLLRSVLAVKIAASLWVNPCPDQPFVSEQHTFVSQRDIGRHHAYVLARQPAMESSMRRLILAATFSVMAPMAMAQMAPPGYGQPGAPMDPAMQRTTTAMGAPSAAAMHPNGENCGTPDEWKACPPLPRHALPYYPPNK